MNSVFPAISGTAAGACFLLAGVSSALVLDRDEDCLKNLIFFAFTFFLWRGKVTRFTRSYFGALTP